MAEGLVVIHLLLPMKDEYELELLWVKLRLRLDFGLMIQLLLIVKRML